MLTMWEEASILLLFAAGMTFLYAGLENLGPFVARLLPRRFTAASERGADGTERKREGPARAAFVGLCLLLLGALTIYAAVSQLRQP